MPSMGVLGAIAGGAKGFSGYLSAEQEQKRQIALEELRTTNRRETNKIDAEMRNDMSLGRLEKSNELMMGRQEQANELSLQRMAKEAELRQSQLGGGTGTALQQNIQFLMQPVEQGGLGLPQEEALAIASPRATQGKSRNEFISDIVSSMSRSDILDVNEITDRASRFADFVYGSEGGQPPAVGVQAPPEAVQMLMQNPSDQMRRQFDEVFGPGASDQALSGQQ
jgi:hypothetical protein